MKKNTPKRTPFIGSPSSNSPPFVGPEDVNHMEAMKDEAMNSTPNVSHVDEQNSSSPQRPTSPKKTSPTQSSPPKKMPTTTKDGEPDSDIKSPSSKDHTHKEPNERSSNDSDQLTSHDSDSFGSMHAAPHMDVDGPQVQTDTDLVAPSDVYPMELDNVVTESNGHDTNRAPLSILMAVLSNILLTSSLSRPVQDLITQDYLAMMNGMGFMWWENFGIMLNCPHMQYDDEIDRYANDTLIPMLDGVDPRSTAALHLIDVIAFISSAPYTLCRLANTYGRDAASETFDYRSAVIWKTVRNHYENKRVNGVKMIEESIESRKNEVMKLREHQQRMKTHNDMKEKVQQDLNVSSRKLTDPAHREKLLQKVVDSIRKEKQAAEEKFVRDVEAELTSLATSPLGNHPSPEPTDVSLENILHETRPKSEPSIS